MQHKHKQQQDYFPFHRWVQHLGPAKAYILWKIHLLCDNDKGCCYASQRGLAEMCGIPYGTFRKDFDWLKDNHFFRFHAPPVIRKPLLISISNKGFYPDKYNAALPAGADCAPIEHSAALPESAYSYEYNEENGGGSADAPPPASTAEQPETAVTATITEEERMDPSTGFEELPPEASRKLCHDLEAVNGRFNVKVVKSMWKVWLQENPIAFISRCGDYFDLKGYEETITRAFEVARPNTVPIKRRYRSHPM